MIYSDFSSTKRTCRFLVGLLFTFIAFEFVGIVVDVIFAIGFKLPNIKKPEDVGKLSANETALVVILIAFFVAWIFVTCCLVEVFLLWVFRSYKNLMFFGTQDLRTTPLGSIAWFFVPVANLIIPLKIMNEISQESAPKNSILRENSTHGSLFISIWWFCLISSIFLQLASFVIGPGINSLGSARKSIGMIANVLSIIAAVLLVKIVKNITNSQTQKSKNIKTQAPPLPPVFNQDFRS